MKLFMQMYSQSFIRCLVLFWLLTGCKLQQPEANAKLHNAVLTNEISVVKKWLRKGASVNYQEDRRGWTPLLFAVEASNYEMAKVLLDHSADPNILSTKNQISPLQRAASKGNLDIIKLLISAGAELDHQDAQLRSTPLMWACLQGHEKAAHLLLDSGALINVRGNRGESALFLAVSTQQTSVVKLLVSYGAITDRPDIYGITPLQKATELKNQDIITLLSE